MTRLKEKGNKQYKGPDKASVAKSAVTYGELIQEMMDFEREYDWATWDNEQIVEVFTREQVRVAPLPAMRAVLMLRAESYLAAIPPLTPVFSLHIHS